MIETKRKASSHAIDIHRLESEFEGVFNEETIEDVVDTLFEELQASSRLTVFLPLLAERFAREQLRAAAERQPREGGGPALN